MEVLDYSNPQYVTRATIAWVRCGERADEYLEECAAYCLDAPATMPVGSHRGSLIYGNERQFTYAAWIGR